MDSSNILQMYQQTTAALQHFREQQDSASTHIELFYTSDAARGQRQALSDIESSMKRPPSCKNNSYSKQHDDDAVIHKSLHDKLRSLADFDQEKEFKIVEGIVSELEKIQNKLLANMGDSDMLSSVEQMDINSISRSKYVFEENLELAKIRLEELVTTHEEKSQKKREDIEQRVIAAQCEKNKELNKFEHMTKQFIRRNLGGKIEFEWESHQKDLSNAQSAILETTNSIDRLKIGIQLLQTAVEKWEQKFVRVRWGHCGTDNSYGAHTFSPFAKDFRFTILRTESAQPATISTDDMARFKQDTAINSQIAIKSRVEDAEHETTPDQMYDSTIDITSATDTAPKHQDLEKGDPKFESLVAASHFPDREPLLEVDNVMNAKSPPCKIHHNTPISLRIKPREYDHNKENISSPLSASSKKSLTLAFDGLDKYAQGLFSSSSRSPASPDIK